MMVFRTAALFAAMPIGASLSHAQQVLPQDAPPADSSAKGKLSQKQLKQLKQQQRQAEALDRFLALPPAQQQQLLQQMAPARRRQAQARLKALQFLSDDERSALRGRAESFAGLAPARRQAVRKEIQILRLMSPEDRRKRLADIKSRFSPDEMSILYGVAGEEPPQEE